MRFHILLLQLLDGLATSQGIRLGEEVGHELIVVVDCLALNMQRILRLGKPDELCGDDSTLMQQLEETVLAVGSRLSEVDHSSLIGQLLTFCIYSLSIALHIQLLNVRSEFGQSLAVRDNGSSRVFLD